MSNFGGWDVKGCISVRYEPWFTTMAIRESEIAYVLARVLESLLKVLELILKLCMTLQVIGARLLMKIVQSIYSHFLV